MFEARYSTLLHIDLYTAGLRCADARTGPDHITFTQHMLAALIGASNRALWTLPILRVLSTSLSTHSRNAARKISIA